MNRRLKNAREASQEDSFNCTVVFTAFGIMVTRVVALVWFSRNETLPACRRRHAFSNNRRRHHFFVWMENHSQRDNQSSPNWSLDHLSLDWTVIAHVGLVCMASSRRGEPSHKADTQAACGPIGGASAHYPMGAYSRPCLPSHYFISKKFVYRGGHHVSSQPLSQDVLANAPNGLTNYCKQESSNT